MIHHHVGSPRWADQHDVLLPYDVTVGTREFDYGEPAAGSVARAHDDDVAGAVDGQRGSPAVGPAVAPGLDGRDGRRLPQRRLVGAVLGHRHEPARALGEALCAAYVHCVAGADGDVVPHVLVGGGAVDGGPLEVWDAAGGGRRRGHRGPGQGGHEEGQGHDKG